jgi:hypothetical protein
MRRLGVFLPQNLRARRSGYQIREPNQADRPKNNFGSRCVRERIANATSAADSSSSSK